jgi:hypothetical protein
VTRLSCALRFAWTMESRNGDRRENCDGLDPRGGGDREHGHAARAALRLPVARSTTERRSMRCLDAGLRPGRNRVDTAELTIAGIDPAEFMRVMRPSYGTSTSRMPGTATVVSNTCSPPPSSDAARQRRARYRALVLRAGVHGGLVDVPGVMKVLDEIAYTAGSSSRAMAVPTRPSWSC